MDEIPDFSPTDPPSENVSDDTVSSIFTRKKPKVTSTPRDSMPRAETPAATARGRKSKHEERRKKILSLLGTVGTGVMFFEQFDGTVILTQAEDMAEATASLADEVPAVAKAIDAMSTGGAYGAFLLSLAAIALPILAHHNLIPAFISSALVPGAPTDDANAA